MLTLRSQLPRIEIIGLLIVLVALAALYLSTLQTIPNGSDHYFMVDVGETQIVLNTWGTLHATGYPLYVITGNILVAGLSFLGVSVVTAPALVSLLWGLVTLTLIYILALHISNNMTAALVTITLFGLTRTMWIHNVIAEIYTMGLALLVLLLSIALWRRDMPHRIYWLAFFGGIAVSHHRAIAIAVPALLYAVWPELWSRRREWPKIISISLLLGLVGFVPYVYLPLRENTGAAWVYGEPNTWSGFLDQFLGREANQFFGLPDSLEMLRSNLALINDVLITDVTLPGLIIGVIGLIVGMYVVDNRRTAITFSLSGGAAYLFHGLFYSDVLSALILPVTFSLAIGWLFLLRMALPLLTTSSHRSPVSAWQTMRVVVAVIVMVNIGGRLYSENRRFITGVTSDPTGLETIELARQVPSGATLMIPWGMRHFAVGFARDVGGELQDMTLVDHKADFAALVAEEHLITPASTFFERPVDWWSQQIGQPVTLQAAEPQLIEITTQGEMIDVTNVDDEIAVVSESISCTLDMITVTIDWVSSVILEKDLSVFVHLRDATGNIIAQADQSAPVFGLRPLTAWQPGEIVHDIYPLPYSDDAAEIRYGLYEQLPDAGFDNVYEFSVPVRCDDA